MRKKKSVIMRVYNNEATLSAALDSMLAQTYENWECVICDDCSTDGTAAILTRYAAKHPERFVLLRNEKNLKLAASLNRCLAFATGELVARMDGDDISLPARFETQVRYLEKHPDVDLMGTAMRRFSETGGLADIIYAPLEPNRFSLHNAIPFHHATIMTYKRVYDALKGYVSLPRTVRAEDWDLWVRFFHAGFAGANSSEVLYLVREDEKALQRRTFHARWQNYPTARIGYRLLGYPKRWLVQEWIITLIKSLTPFFVQKMYRNYQKKRYTRETKII